MTCKICNIIANKETLQAMKLYEDDQIIALLSKKPASLSHVLIFPKKHYTILEQVPDQEVAKLFSVANNISRAMFESLNIQGTNIFLQNGVAAGQEEAHLMLQIIARMENDGVKLDWEPKKLGEEEMSTIELSYKQFTDGTVYTSDGKKEEKQEISESKEKIEDDGENYMVKYFNKMP